MENEVKEPAPKYGYVSPEEYLEMERKAEEKSEYFDGIIYAMSGASTEHNTISINIISEIGPFLKDKDCKPFMADMRVSTPSHNSYMYPDLLIYCGKKQLADDKFDTLLNPSVIIEILSSSTRSIDKKRKFFYYREIPSLKEYIMVDAKKRHIVTVRKQKDDSWKFEEINDEKNELLLKTINFKISLENIYEGTDL